MKKLNRFSQCCFIGLSVAFFVRAETPSHQAGPGATPQGAAKSPMHPVAPAQKKELAADRTEEFVPNPLKVKLTEEQREMFRQVNQWRRAHRDQYGKPLEMVAPAALLNKASCTHATWMATNNSFMHASSLAGNGFRSENISAGLYSPVDTANQWKNSPGHNTNMLGANYRYMGVCRAHNPNTQFQYFWTQNFSSGPEQPEAIAK